MSNGIRLGVAWLIFGVAAACAESTTSAEAILLRDDFTSYPAGCIFDVVGAEMEYQYLPVAKPTGCWTVSNFKSDPASQRAWRVLREDGTGAMGQFYKNTSKDYHLMLSAGDRAWTDYSLSVKLVPESLYRWNGVAIRYRHDRCFYFAGLDEDRFVLSVVDNGTAFRQLKSTRLAEAEYRATAGTVILLKVTVQGARISASIEGGPTITADDSTYASGGIALVADAPSRFEAVSVTTDLATKRTIDKTIAERAAEEVRLQGENPTMKLWKKFQIKDYGVGRSVRFGDLDGDGQLDMLFGQMIHHGPRDRASELSCLTAVTLDGKTLWQIGKADAWKSHLTNDVAFQVQDLDGDGKNEVIYCMNQELVVADGATGNMKQKIPTPVLPENTPAENKYSPRLLGDALFFCDLHGLGRDTDMILKDRYTNYWAFDSSLSLMWQGQCKTGHYPYAMDIDGDGKDEVAIGYTLLDDDGKVLWSLDKEIEDHCDGVAIASLREGEEPRVFSASSDEGLYIADLKGKVLQHEYLGHVQNPSIGNFRPDLPGLEVITVDFWGNQGIFNFFDANGKRYLDMEPGPYGSLALPVNWRGDGSELFVVSPNPDSGGLYDGWGRRAMRFPADGHPDMCYNVLDLCGDCRDEIVVWDPYEVWIYTQADSPQSGRLYKPHRNPLYTESNYRAAVSLPGWSDDKK